LGEVARSRQARLGALSLVLALAILHNLLAGKAKRCPKRESRAQRRALAQKWVLDRGVFLLPDTIIQALSRLPVGPCFSWANSPLKS